MQFDIISGDFRGKATPTNRFAFGGTQGKYFEGLKLPDRVYPPGEIKRVKVLDERTVTDTVGAASATLAAGLAFGILGALSASKGAGVKSTWTIGVEFKDGKKAVLRTSTPTAINIQVFRNFIEENGLLDIDF